MNAAFKKTALLTVLIVVCGLCLRVPAAATLQTLQVGAEAPDFSLQTLDGDTKAFADLKGTKLTVVLFWSTWSRNSAAALRRMEELYRRYADRGLSVIAVNADAQTLDESTLEQIREEVKREKLTFPVLLDDHLQTFSDFGVIALPSMLVLDPNRIIRYELSGYPLVGAEELVDFLSASIEGRSLAPSVAAKTGYQPNAKALRLFNMGRNTLRRSRRMAGTAEIWFKKAIEADPGFMAPRLSLGKFYLDRGRTDDAREQFEQALSRDPDNVVALCETGMLKVEAGKTAEGKAMLKKGLKLDESYTPCYYYLGYITGREGKPKDAQTLFAEAEKINRLDPDIFVYQGRMYEELKDSRDAAVAYRKALETVLAGE
jgi:peroxiredoxin/Tfp pilus assembly protein PilF